MNASEAEAPDQTVDAFWLPSQLSALEMLRRPVESAVYTSLAFSHRLAERGLAQSFGSTGDAFDNAAVEAFWATLKLARVLGQDQARGGATQFPLLDSRKDGQHARPNARSTCVVTHMSVLERT